jgi:putative transcriptional regulator
MAILVRLDEKLHERRMTLTELAARVDITVANLSILKTGKAKAIRFSTLEAICAVLSASPATARLRSHASCRGDACPPARRPDIRARSGPRRRPPVQVRACARSSS